MIHCYCFSQEVSNSLFQIRRHGPAHRPGQDHRGRVLAVRRPRDRAPRARHRVQLLEDISSEPAGGQAQGTEGELTFDKIS